MVAGEVESSCQVVATFFFFFFFFFLVSPYQTVEISLGQPSPPSYQLLPPPLVTGLPQRDLAPRKQVTADLGKEKLVEHLTQDTTLP